MAWKLSEVPGMKGRRLPDGIMDKIPNTSVSLLEEACMKAVVENLPYVLSVRVDMNLDSKDASTVSYYFASNSPYIDAKRAASILRDYPDNDAFIRSVVCFNAR